jgi:glycosyltransferase involved in cell wall biosynthesis
MSPGQRLRRVAFVVGTTAGGTGTHVAMLAEGCAARGTAVSVSGPAATGRRLGFASPPEVVFTPVEFGDRPRPGDAIAVLRLRRALLSGGTPDVVHAHGLRAGALAVLALGRIRVRRRPRLVVTVHNAPPAGGGVPALIYRLLERLVARRADMVLCVSSDLEDRMRAAGARRIGHAVVPAPQAPTATTAAIPADLADSQGRPIVLAVGRLAAQKGFDTLLEAATSWRDMDPEPLLVIAGDGPLAASLSAEAASLGIAPRFLGHRGDVPALLAAAAVFVLPSRWEGQPLILQEALRAGAPIVATNAGGIPDLTGDDAALLVPPADPKRLADAVREVLTDQALATRLRAKARDRGAGLPTQDEAVTAALTSYAQALR